MKEQFILRVKRGSELGKALEALSQDSMTDDELKVVGGKARTHWLVRQLPKWFDNVGIKNIHGDREAPIELTYENVLPSQVDVIGDLTLQGVNVSGKSETAVEDALRWPSSPPLIETLDNFDKPKWFDTMKFAVEQGRHISLEGPPGVGKDTAIQQLAAQIGKTLVTIGGDAGFRRRDLVGTAHISNGTSRFEVGEYAAAAVNGWWVLLTEVNAADPDALMYINAQLAPPYVVTIQGRAYPVHEDFRIFVSYNHGLIGTKPLPQSFKDRFFSIKATFFTKSQLTRRLQSMGMNFLPENERSNGIIIDFGIKMWEAHKNGQMRYQVTTRRLADALLLVNLNEQDAESAIEAAVIAAIDSPVETRAADRVLSDLLNVVARRESYG